MAAPNPSFHIRPARLEDVPQLCRFADEYLTRMHASAGGKEARQVFQHVIKNADGGVIVVSEANDALCAYAYASFEWRSEFGGETMHCLELFVDPLWRNKGVAARLVAWLIDIAKQRGIRRISAEVHPGNAIIERILETSGFDPEHRTIWSRSS